MMKKKKSSICALLCGAFLIGCSASDDETFTETKHIVHDGEASTEESSASVEESIAIEIGRASCRERTDSLKTVHCHRNREHIST